MSRSPFQDVRTYFDGESSRYLDERYRRRGCDQFAYQSRRRLVLDLIGGGPGRIIDIGSGPGIFTATLQEERGFDVIEVDVSLEMLRESRARVEQESRRRRVTFVEGCLPNLPFAERTFDAALCIGVLAYVDDPALALREIRRLLRTDGVAIIQVSNALCPTSRLHSLLRRCYRRLSSSIGGRAYPHLWIPLTSFRLRALRALLEQEHFRLHSWARYDFRPPLLEWLLPSAALAASRSLQRFERADALGLLAEGIVLRADAC